MFLDDDNSGRRGLFGGRRNRRVDPVLRVTAKPLAWAKTDSQRIAVILLSLVAVTAVSAVLWIGLSLAQESLFTRNDRYLIRDLNIEVKAGAVVTEQLVREYTGIGVGTNLFGFDIDKARLSVMQVPNVKSVEITRELPGSVDILVVERTPAARIGRTGAVGADAEGAVFVTRGALGRLPVILGCSQEDPAPGSRISGSGLAALVVADICRDVQPAIRVSSIDAGREGGLLVRMASGGRTLKVPLPRNDVITPEYRDEIRKKLAGAVRAWQSPEGRKHRHLDATYQDEIIGQ